jgi:TPR repeat protein
MSGVVASCLEKGEGISKNSKGAAYYYKFAADQGHAKGQYRYALCLIPGCAVDRNLPDAFRYLKLSADNGDPDGQLAFACMTENGIGLFSSLDLLTAVRYSEQCSDLSAAGAACLMSGMQTGR